MIVLENISSVSSYPKYKVKSMDMDKTKYYLEPVDEETQGRLRGTCSPLSPTSLCRFVLSYAPILSVSLMSLTSASAGHGQRPCHQHLSEDLFRAASSHPSTERPPIPLRILRSLLIIQWHNADSRSPFEEHTKTGNSGTQMSDTEQDPLASVGASKVESKLSDSMVFDSSLYQDFEPVGEEGDSKAMNPRLRRDSLNSSIPRPESSHQLQCGGQEAVPHGLSSQRDQGQFPSNVQRRREERRGRRELKMSTCIPLIRTCTQSRFGRPC